MDSSNEEVPQDANEGQVGKIAEGLCIMDPSTIGTLICEYNDEGQQAVEEDYEAEDGKNEGRE